MCHVNTPKLIACQTNNMLKLIYNNLIFQLFIITCIYMTSSFSGKQSFVTYKLNKLWEIFRKQPSLNCSFISENLPNSAFHEFLFNFK